MDGTEDTIKETIVKKNDGMIAVAILVIAVVAVVLFALRYFKKSKKANFDPT